MRKTTARGVVLHRNTAGSTRRSSSHSRIFVMLSARTALSFDLLISTENTTSSFLLAASSRDGLADCPFKGRAVIRHRSFKLLREFGCLDLMFKLHADERPGPRDHVFKDVRPVSAPI